MTIAKGEFDVSLQPLDAYAAGVEGIRLGRMSIDKTFHGDLEATSKGEMLSARTKVQTSAGYVALEQVEGTLDGKQGSFVLQHFGVTQGENNRLLLEVVPDSGTGELQALSGSMTIEVREGKHFYAFEYDLGW